MSSEPKATEPACCEIARPSEPKHVQQPVSVHLSSAKYQVDRAPATAQCCRWRTKASVQLGRREGQGQGRKGERVDR